MLIEWRAMPVNIRVWARQVDPHVRAERRKQPPTPYRINAEPREGRTFPVLYIRQKEVQREKYMCAYSMRG